MKNEHEQTIRLAAASLSDSLGPGEARALEQHLHDCPACRREQAALSRDQDRLRALVAPQPVTDTVRADVLAAVRAPARIEWTRILLVAALVLLLLAALVFRVGSQPAQLPMGFVGSWSTTNCAMWWAAGERPTIDCDRWGDGTAIRLDIGPSEPNAIQVLGTGMPECRGSGSANVPPPQVRPGTFLYFEIDGPLCESIELGDDRASHLYLEPGDQRIWFDDDGDGWGLFWTRVR